MSVSAVITTRNEETNIERVIRSIKWVDEIIVCDMYSEDKTQSIAKKLGAKIYLHKPTGFVEPARNFSISKASSDWILVLDADEEVPDTLKHRLSEITKQTDQVSFVEIPRKNLIFGKWIQNKGWWPDYHIRFFRRSQVIWRDEIHSKPETKGVGLTLEPKEEFALIHHHYDSVSQYLNRLNIYTSIQAKELVETGHKFRWQDLIEQSMKEFLSRFFDREGYKDGIHGLALSFLQAFSMLMVYLKIWEQEKFLEEKIELAEFEKLLKIFGNDLDYWFGYSQKSQGLVNRIKKKIKRSL